MNDIKKSTPKKLRPKKLRPKKSTPKKSTPKKLTPEQQRLTDAKQVSYYKLPDSPTSKRKGKRAEPDHRQWIPCPLLPGVPAIPPPRIPQPWEVLRSHETTSAAEVDVNGVTEGTAPSILKGLLEMSAAPPSTLQDPLGLTNDVRRAERLDKMAAPRAKKGKGKGKGKGKRTEPENRQCIPCPLPGASSIPSLRILQPWEVIQRHEMSAPAEDRVNGVIECTSPSTIQDPLDFTTDEQIAERLEELTAPRPKEGNGNRTEPDHRQWILCPLSGVPAIPPPRIPQPWEVLRSHETTSAAKVDVNDEDTPPLIILQGPHPDLTKDERRAESVEDIAPRPKKRRLQFSSSKDTKLPGNPVLADIEYLNFAPTSSRTEPSGSGRNAISNNVSLDMDVDIERDLGSDTNSGSELEAEERNVAGTSLRPSLKEGVMSRNAVDDFGEPNPTEAIYLLDLDAEEDQVIRNLAAGDDDVLSFDWCSQYSNFAGVREQFSGPSGPTFDHSGLSPLQVFELIWDTSIIDHIVRETNKYARELQSRRARQLASRLSRWKETNREEIWRFFTILMLQSLIVNNTEREYWYPSNDQMRIGNFGTLMQFNRFLLIKRCLHFADNSSLPEHPSKLDKIKPVIEHLNKKFGTLYLPEQNVAIDESLLLWKGRLSFSQKIATKRAREGIKSFEICESRTGYLWKMEVYSGKGHVHGAVEGKQADEPENATSQIVFNLMRPLFGKGHTLVMDNYYNSPLLSRLLKAKHQTDTMGTLRLNREFVPEGLKDKTKKNMRTGEVCFSSTKDICVVVYMDRNVVPMISTFHGPEVGGKSKFGSYRYKPKVILDYNLSMGGIDRKDQLLSSYPIERSRNLCWYKKLFRRLLNVSIHNASVIHDHGRKRSGKLGNRPFRLQLLKEMLEKYCAGLPPPRPFAPPCAPPPRPTPSQMHLPVKGKPQRCKLCYRNKVRRSTVWSCGTCQVHLCIEGCYTVYHNELCQ